MNELELIREFRSEVPYPDAVTTARAKAAVLPPPRRRTRRRWPFALAATAAAAVAAFVIVLLQSGSPDSAAAAVLERTARTAAGQPATAPPRPGQFVYTKSRSLNETTSVTHGQAINTVADQTREAWIGPDGSGRLRETSVGSRFMSDRDRQAWVAAGRPDLGGEFHSDERFGAGGLYFFDLSKLPTDADSLKKTIEQRKVEGGPPGDAETFTIVGDMLRETYASPQLRAALYRVAAGLPGVELIGDVKDESGRTGTAVGYSNDRARNDLIFDPKTSALLGERTVEHGKVVSWTVYLASGVVDSTSATP
jgi:hypothetical protein